MDAPRKYWWVVLVAVPIAVAVIGLAATTVAKWGSGSGTSGISYQNYGGTQTNISGGVAFTTLNVMLDEARRTSGTALSEEQIELLTAAMQQVEARKLDAAIPLLESVAQAAPLPSVLNNLAAAYLAAGEAAKAAATLERAQAAPADSVQATAAIQHNLRQATAAQSPIALSPWQPTKQDGVVAALTRCDDAGGMLTVEITYRNESAGGLHVYVGEDSAYLLDESTGAKVGELVAGSYFNQGLASDRTMVSWAKFRLDGPPPKRLTVVAHHVQRSFENVPCTVTGG